MSDSEFDVAFAYEKSQNDLAFENQPQCQIESQQTPESSLAFHQSQNAWVPYGSRSNIDYENEFKNFITHTSTPNGKFHVINLYFHKNINKNNISKCN